MAGSNEKVNPHLNIKFIFNFCNDVEVMRYFYSDLLGMQQCAFCNDEKWGWVCYQCEGLQLMFLRDDDGVAIQTKWAAQPGWEGGELPVSSWSLEVPTLDEFTAIYGKLKDAGVKLFHRVPEWRQDSYGG